MLENQNPFMTLWKTDALFGNSLTGLFQVIENLIKRKRPLQRTSNPGHFVLYQIQRLKKQIRIAAEEEELESYESYVERLAGRLKPLTDWHKVFLETAPYLIIVLYAMNLTQKEKKNNYVQESVGLQDFLLAAIHNAGLLH
jgi:hypothetical protein